MNPLRFSGRALYGILILSGAFLFISLRISAANIPSEKEIKAFEAVLSLQFGKAGSDLSKEKPDIFTEYILNYADFLKAFITEEDQYISIYEEKFSVRSEFIEKSYKNNPFRNYFLGNMDLQYAFIKLKQGKYLSAAGNFSSAFRYLNENEKTYPSFIPDKTVLGILHIMAGAVPDKYKNLLSVAGFSGDVERGLNELREVIGYVGNDEFTNICRGEALLYLSLGEGSYSADKMAAVKVISSYDPSSGNFPEKNNPLYVFVKSRIMMQAGMNEEAIDVLKAFHPGKEMFPFYALDFLYGKAKLNKLDQDADFYLQRFVTYYRGKTWIKSAYQRLAWHALLNGHPEKYEVYRKMVAVYGSSSSETDKQAYKESTSNDPVSLPLLKTRLLFDGGYYDKALDILLDNSVSSVVHNKKDLIEYNYRLGRIYQEKNNVEKALFYFDKTISAGTREPWYFAANAALQSGLIMEKREKYPDAMRFYKKCLEMDSQEYKTGFDQKAKAGIKRVGKYLN